MKIIIYAILLSTLFLNYSNLSFASDTKIAGDSENLSRTAFAQKKKIIMIDYAHTITVPMNSSGCSRGFVQIGVSNMPKSAENFSIKHVTGEYDFDMHGNTGCFSAWWGPYHYYPDANWIKWASQIATARIICAPIAVVWNG